MPGISRKRYGVVHNLWSAGTRHRFPFLRPVQSATPPVLCARTATLECGDSSPLSFSSPRPNAEPPEPRAPTPSARERVFDRASPLNPSPSPPGSPGEKGAGRIQSRARLRTAFDGGGQLRRQVVPAEQLVHSGQDLSAIRINLVHVSRARAGSRGANGSQR